MKNKSEIFFIIFKNKSETMGFRDGEFENIRMFIKRGNLDLFKKTLEKCHNDVSVINVGKSSNAILVTCDKQEKKRF